MVDQVEGQVAGEGWVVGAVAAVTGAEVKAVGWEAVAEDLARVAVPEAMSPSALPL